ncbi:hypothetical protein NQZ68_005660 [Dissostichus eleginoides]|nr:hypothetical protein NQZ68_005660 [Dissostichus eleginoides]
MERDAFVSHMALRTEAPSTGSQREPSRLEQNTNQRLTGHSHSPHQAWLSHSGPAHPTLLHILPPTVKDG